jgi:hypothetical protein
VADFSWVPLLASLRVNKIERHEPSGEKFLRIAVSFAAFVSIYSDDPRFGILNQRFLP